MAVAIVSEAISSPKCLYFPSSPIHNDCRGVVGSLSCRATIHGLAHFCVLHLVENIWKNYRKRRNNVHAILRVETFRPGTTPGIDPSSRTHRGPSAFDSVHGFAFQCVPMDAPFLFYSEQLLACYSSMEFLGVRIWGNWTSVPAPKEDCPLNPVDVYQYVYDREWQEALEVGGHVGFMDWGMSKRIEKTRLGAQALTFSHNPPGPNFLLGQIFYNHTGSF
eukprot:g10968.t1